MIRVLIRVALLGFLVSFFTFCNEEKVTIDPSFYLNKSQQDSIELIIAYYTSKEPKMSEMDNFPFEDRFLDEHKEYYEIKKDYLDLLCYYPSQENNKRYFYSTKLVSSDYDEKRGTGGYFVLNEKGEIIDFDVYFVTQRNQEEIVNVRGEEVFLHMIKEDNVDKYFGDLDYMEWPDSTVYFSKETYDWEFYAHKHLYQ